MCALCRCSRKVNFLHTYAINVSGPMTTFAWHLLNTYCICLQISVLGSIFDLNLSRKKTQVIFILFMRDTIFHGTINHSKHDFQGILWSLIGAISTISSDFPILLFSSHFYSTQLHYLENYSLIFSKKDFSILCLWNPICKSPKPRSFVTQQLP